MKKYKRAGNKMIKQKCWTCDNPTVIIRGIEYCPKCDKKWYTLEQWGNKVIYDKVVNKINGVK